MGSKLAAFAAFSLAVSAGPSAAAEAASNAVLDTGIQPPTARSCRSAMNIGLTGPDREDAVYIQVRGVTCAAARGAARAWARSQPASVVVARPWTCRHAGDRIRCVKPGSAVSFAYAHWRPTPAIRATGS